MHLHCIEAADSPADASWGNINALDDLARDILTTTSHLTVAALHGNASAGGVFLALAADRVLARSGVILNPHYRNMGNLYGSEYWTYLLPQRVGAAGAQSLMNRRLPLGTAEARRQGLIYAHAGPDLAAFRALIESQAFGLATNEAFTRILAEKRARREHDEQIHPLAAYRAAELERMRVSFYGFDPSYHIARHRFVYRTPHAWTPLHLAQHRRLVVPIERESAPA
jgi:putative two-component system hydrogenase maturation factor HypX/HoxX